MCPPLIIASINNTHNDHPIVPTKLQNTIFSLPPDCHIENIELKKINLIIHVSEFATDVPKTLFIKFNIIVICNLFYSYPPENRFYCIYRPNELIQGKCNNSIYLYCLTTILSLQMCNIYLRVVLFYRSVVLQKCGTPHFCG